MKNKYMAKKIKTDYGTFDSMKEYKHFKVLMLKQEKGEIYDLQRQVKFELIPSQKINGKVVERAVTYNADFTYFDSDGKFHVEDTKSPITKTRDYIIKRKLMLWVHEIQIEEV